jgi:hypothetical protein
MRLYCSMMHSRSALLPRADDALISLSRIACGVVTWFVLEAQ